MTNKCNGTGDQPRDKQARSYCEGRHAATAGGVLGDNPHESGSDEYANWERGFNSYNAGVGTPYQDCCAEPGYT